MVHFKQNKYKEAIQAFTKFSELKPDNPDAYYNTGVGYLQLKKYEEALKPLQRAIELRPDYALAHYNLALAYFVLGDRFSANQEYKTLQGLNADLAEKLRKIIFKR
jgi:tetratricopeptide (TPR) repeat protein